MSGLRSHRERIMTCFSPRSGMASNGRFAMDQAPQRQPANTRANTRNLFFTEKVMIRLIKVGPAGDGCESRYSPHAAGHPAACVRKKPLYSSTGFQNQQENSPTLRCDRLQ